MSAVEDLKEIIDFKELYIHKTLKVFSILSIPSLIASLSRIYALGFQPIFLFFVIVNCIPPIIYLTKSRFTYKTITLILCLTLFFTGIVSFLAYSYYSMVLVYFLNIILLSVFFFDKKTSFLFLGIVILFFIITAILFFLNYIHFSVDFNYYNSLKSVWATQICSFILFALLLIHLMSSFHKTLYDTILQTKAKTEDLKFAVDKAEESDRLKTVFLQNMSHEIRTPMNAILGFSSLLQDLELSKEKQKQYINIISQRTTILLDVINDIMDLSRMETETLVLNTRFGTISESLNEVVNYYENRKAFYENDLMFCVSNNLPENKNAIVADFDKLQRVLFILTDNAIKFTEKGNIMIECDSLNQMLQFRVSDTGIGINPNNLKMIFDHFRQADEIIDSRKFGGTGLGLSIAKKIIETMGGEIWAENNALGGATFSFTIRYQELPKENINSFVCKTDF
jgi:signal transduction histidine kinase